MTKTKSPFFSLGAQGTVGDIITAQKRHDRTLLRKKPIPAYRYSLAQAYQRWLYQDYAYLWTQQSMATQRTYHSLGSRHHMTGFAYWMRVYLKTMPDRRGWWTLDATTSAVCYDRTPNNNDGVIVGATQMDGLIDGALGFDGINNVVNIPGSASLAVIDPITIEAFIRPDSILLFKTILGKRTGADVNFVFRTDRANLLFYFWDGAWNFWTTNTNPLTALTWQHVLVTYIAGINPQIYVNAAHHAGGWAPGAPGPLVPDSQPAYIGRIPAGDPFAGRIDNVILYNRVLDQTEILLRASRRYPP